MRTPGEDKPAPHVAPFGVAFSWPLVIVVGVRTDIGIRGDVDANFARAFAEFARGDTTVCARTRPYEATCPSKHRSALIGVGGMKVAGLQA